MALTTGSFAALLVLAFGVLTQVNAAPTRERRSLWELNTLISCYTGRSGFLINGYGCWCGLGGSGKPVDGTDRCCQGHDYCYGILQDHQCGVYFSSYPYTKHGCNTGNGYITCASNNGCDRALCECDRRLAECVHENRDSYHEAFANFEKRFCDVGLDYIVTNSSITMVGGDEADAYHVANVIPQQQVDTQADVGGAGFVNHLDTAPQDI